MRRTFILLTGASIVALAFARGSSSNLLSSFSKAINGANTVSSTYTFQTVSRTGPEDYSIILKKPNLVHIETPSKTIIADGTQITTYDKKDKTYFKQPETPALLKLTLAPDELHVFAGFFDANAYDALSAKDLGSKTVKGGTMNVVEASYDAHQRRVITYLLNPDDKIARKAEIDLNDPQQKVAMVLDTKSMSVNGTVSDSAFTFDPPTDSRELTADEINNAKWYYDLDEAKRVAQATNKKIFVDFFATWCGPCKRLEADCFSTDQFKAFGKKLVFCRIDVDAQKSVMEAYGIEAMPTQDILNKDGSVLTQKVGYANPDDFFAFLTGAVGAP